MRPDGTLVPRERARRADHRSGGRGGAGARAGGRRRHDLRPRRHAGRARDRARGARGDSCLTWVRARRSRDPVRAAGRCPRARSCARCARGPASSTSSSRGMTSRRTSPARRCRCGAARGARRSCASRRAAARARCCRALRRPGSRRGRARDGAVGRRGDRSTPRAIYTVETIGFAPGFAYLGGLDPRARATAPRDAAPARARGLDRDRRAATPRCIRSSRRGAGT